MEEWEYKTDLIVSSVTVVFFILIVIFALTPLSPHIKVHETIQVKRINDASVYSCSVYASNVSTGGTQIYTTNYSLVKDIRVGETYNIVTKKYYIDKRSRIISFQKVGE